MRVPAQSISLELWHKPWRWHPNDDAGILEADPGSLTFHGINQPVRLDTIEHVRMARPKLAWRPMLAILAAGAILWAIILSFIANVAGFTLAETVPGILIALTSTAFPLAFGVIVDKREWMIVRGVDPNGNATELRLRAGKRTRALAAFLEGRA